MSDISKCNGDNEWGTCPMRDSCARYTAPVNQFQCFMTTPFFFEQGIPTCGYYWRDETKSPAEPMSVGQVISRMEERIKYLKQDNDRLSVMVDRLSLDLGLKEHGFVAAEREDDE